MHSYSYIPCLWLANYPIYTYTLHIIVVKIFYIVTSNSLHCWNLRIACIRVLVHNVAIYSDRVCLPLK